MFIILNKYEQAYENIKSFIRDDDHTEVWTKSYLLSLEEDINILNELVIQIVKENQPILEEIKKEWEELGYEWRIPKEYPHMIWIVDDDEEEKWVLRIKINTQSKTYWKLWGDGSFDKFTLQEHQLLTKTFRALGWYDE